MMADLPSSGNKRHPMAASRIRNAFHDQLADLWDNHVILRQLARTARVWPTTDFSARRYIPPRPLPDYNDPIKPPAIGDEVDLCASMPVPNVGSFIPLVRNSLYLACAVDVLFLRHEDPFIFMKQGGDLDGRNQCLTSN
jgi:hypothetical protein